MPKKLWYDAINEAEDLIKRDVSMQIQGYDIDGDMIKAARQNAEDAGVLDYIHFQQRPVSQLSHAKKYGFVITNEAVICGLTPEKACNIKEFAA